MAVSFDVTIGAGVPDGTLISNTMTATPSNGPTAASNTAETVVGPAAAAVLELTKSVDVADAQPGSTLTYTLVVTNTGNADTAAVQVDDTPDANTTLVAGSTTTTAGTCTETVGIVCDVGVLAASGGSATITFEVTINADVAADTAISNQATATGGVAGPASSNTAITIVVAPDPITPPQPEPEPQPEPQPEPEPQPVTATASTLPFTGTGRSTGPAAAFVGLLVVLCGMTLVRLSRRGTRSLR